MSYSNASEKTLVAATGEAERKGFYELEHKGDEQNLLKEILLQIMDDLRDSPIYKHEVLIILLAKLDTEHILKIKFAKTEMGQLGKALYEVAKDRFEYNGVVEKSPLMKESEGHVGKSD